MIEHDDTVRDVISDGEVPRETEDEYYAQTENDELLLKFIVSTTDPWRDYRDQNFSDEWKKYERNFRCKWSSDDKTRGSERSRVMSPATQQAIETRHAEIMEAIFGQGEYFDIKDDLNDENGTKLDVEKLKNQLKEDFAHDKIRKSIENISLLAEIYGMGIGEVTVSTEKKYIPMRVPVGNGLVQYGVGEKDRFSVKLNPVNPNNFLWDPNATSIDDCMGVAIEKYVSVHKIIAGIQDERYRKIEVSTLHKDDSLEVTQEKTEYRDNKVLLLTYYGLVPRKMLESDDDSSSGRETDEISDEEDRLYDPFEDYEDMVEAIVVIANGIAIIKAEESPYMMKDRPIVYYQADTVPNRIPGRGTAEKALNMQASIDGSIRSHMDSLALMVPMIAVDATRVPRGFNMEIQPGKNIMVNGSPNDILTPFKFGMNDGAQMDTAKEFERMLLMATGTMDSAGQVQQVSRDGGMDTATATIIKKYKRTLINFQEDFLIPFIYKAAWRYMQFDPERYPALDVTFLPTATIGIIAREYEQKQLAFLIQTLGANSPLTPVLMQGIVENSSLHNKQEMIEQMAQLSQPDPQMQQMQQQEMMLAMNQKQADVMKTQAEAQKTAVEAQLAPDLAKAKIVAALSTNLDDDNEGKDFERRARIADLMLREKDIDSNEKIARLQMVAKNADIGEAVGNDIGNAEPNNNSLVSEPMMPEESVDSGKAKRKKTMHIITPSGQRYIAERDDNVVTLSRAMID